MKLFLASSLDETISLLAPKLPKSSKGCKVLFVSNAADNQKDPWWVSSDRDAFVSLGCEVTDLDLRQTTKESLKETLTKADVIHFCGGSVLYLLSILQSRELTPTITQAVRSGKVLYTGTSAGSMIAAKDVTLGQYDDEETEHLAKLSGFAGLGLVNFMILPHSNSADFSKSNKLVMEHAPENQTPLIAISDGQAVYVEDEKFEIVSV